MRSGWMRAIGWCGVAMLAGLACGSDRQFVEEIVVYVRAGVGGEGAVAAASGAGGDSTGSASEEGQAGNLSVDDSMGAAGTESEPVELLALGQACELPTDCESGFCVDGLCCDSACVEVCASCGLAGSEGQCSVQASDPQCAALSCPAETECLKYDQSQVANNCEAVGSCRAEVECAAQPVEAGTACGQDGAGACDEEGRCIVEGKASLGEACAVTEDCAEGACVAGPDGGSICCDSACDGTCQACGADGRCNVTPEADEQCGEVGCPPDDVCRDYENGTAGQCRGFSQCATALDCTFTELRDPAQCQCDAEGSCSLRLGQSCESDEQCPAPGACEATSNPDVVLCCSQRCPEGSFCRSNGQGCAQCEDGAPAQCEGNAEVTCQGGQLARRDCPNGCTAGVGCNDRAPVGFLCNTAQCQAGAVCQADTTGAQRCCARDCAAEGRECSPSGSCECPPGTTAGAGGCALQQGDPCTPGGTACDTGLTCVDGVCCASACGGACERCDAQGQCVADLADTQQCGGGRQCVGQGDCRSANQSSCSGDGECVSNNCEPRFGGGGQICCGQACDGERPSCSTDGSRCVACQSNQDCDNGCNLQQGVCNPPRNLGETCQQGPQCGSGNCVPADDQTGSRCCPNCAFGQLCNQQGQCVNPPAGAGQGCQSNGDCAGGLTCANGVCCRTACNGPCQRCRAGTGNCDETPTTDNRCGPFSCNVAENQCRDVNAPPAGQCVGFGDCASAQDCQVTILTGNACGNNLQCSAQGECNVDTRAPAGSPCSTDGDCQTGNCVTSASNPAQGICCLESCGNGELCSVLAFNQHRCDECSAASSSCANGCNVATGQCNDLLADGEACQNDNQCAGTCVTHYLDEDDDEFALLGAPTARFCRTGNFDIRGYTARQPTGATTNTDCCDSGPGAATVRPSQTGFFETASACPGVGFDYNCSGVEEPRYVFVSCEGAVPPSNGGPGSCSRAPGTIGYSADTIGQPCGSNEVVVVFCDDTNGNGVCTTNGAQGQTKQCH